MVSFNRAPRWPHLFVPPLQPEVYCGISIAAPGAGGFWPAATLANPKGGWIWDIANESAGANDARIYIPATNAPGIFFPTSSTPLSQLGAGGATLAVRGAVQAVWNAGAINADTNYPGFVLGLVVAGTQPAPRDPLFVPAGTNIMFHGSGENAAAGFRFRWLELP